MFTANVFVIISYILEVSLMLRLFLYQFHGRLFNAVLQLQLTCL